MRHSNEIDSITHALQKRFDYDYGVGLDGFDVEDGNDGHLIINKFTYGRRCTRCYEVEVKYKLGKYICKISKFRGYYDEGILINMFEMDSDDPQEIVDWVIKTIAHSAKTIDINESVMRSRLRRGRMLREHLRHRGYMMKEDEDSKKKYEVVNEPPYESATVLLTTDDYDEAVALIKKYAKEKLGRFKVRDAETRETLANEWNEWTLWSITHDNT